MNRPILLASLVFILTISLTIGSGFFMDYLISDSYITQRDCFDRSYNKINDVTCEVTIYPNDPYNMINVIALVVLLFVLVNILVLIALGLTIVEALKR